MPYFKADTSASQEAKQKIKEEDAKRGFKWWSPKEGENFIRILPPWTDQGDYAYKWWRDLWIHWGVGPESNAFACPRKAGVGPCYICEQVDVLRQGDEADQEMAGDLAARRRYFMNIVDLNEPEDDEGNPKVQIFGAGILIYKELLDYFCDPDWGDLSDPDEGYTVKIDRTGTGKKTKYSVRLKGKQGEPLPNADALDKINDLYLVMEYKPYEALQAAYEGVEQEALPGAGSAGGLPGGTPTGQETTTASNAEPEEEAEPEAEEDDSYDFSEVDWGTAPLDKAGVATKVGLEEDDLPNCYEQEYDAGDAFCQECAVFVPCGIKTEANKAPKPKPKSKPRSKPKSKPKSEDKPAEAPADKSEEDIEAEMKAALAGN